MSSMKKTRIVFMGSTSFSLESLKAIVDGGYNVVAVYTQSPKPSGRNYKMHKTVVHEFTESQNIQILHPKKLRNSEEELNIFKSLQADLVIVSSYGLIIPESFLQIPKYGFINIHASLLPNWRGAAPIQSAILSGDKQTGITIMKMDSGVDTGDIISMESIDITPKTNHGRLERGLAILGSNMILKFLSSCEFLIKNAQKQSNADATFSQKIDKDSCEINWNNSAVDILRHIMAYAPVPGAWSTVCDIRLKIFDADIISNHINTSMKIGEISDAMIVKCGSDSYIQLTSVQQSGKNKMSAVDFLRGHVKLIGERFVSSN